MSQNYQCTCENDEQFMVKNCTNCNIVCGEHTMKKCESNVKVVGKIIGIVIGCVIGSILLFLIFYAACRYFLSGTRYQRMDR